MQHLQRAALHSVVWGGSHHLQRIPCYQRKGRVDLLRLPSTSACTGSNNAHANAEGRTCSGGRAHQKPAKRPAPLCCQSKQPGHQIPTDITLRTPRPRRDRGAQPRREDTHPPWGGESHLLHLLQRTEQDQKGCCGCSHSLLLITRALRRRVRRRPLQCRSFRRRSRSPPLLGGRRPAASARRRRRSGSATS